MKKVLTSIGLMSGTSCDGVDASMISSDGEDKLDFILNHYIPYNKDLKFEIKNLKESINNFSDLTKHNKQILKIEDKITLYHIKCVKELILKKNNFKIDIIGIHGHTIFHSKREKISKQLFNARLFKENIKKNFIYNFRENDINFGGEGAPLTPIFHKVLRNKLNLLLPTVFINIGGIANLTYIDGNQKLVSFDCGPGNALVDYYIQKRSGFNKNFDDDGQLASNHNYNDVILNTYLSDNYYDLNYPKSLDVNDFSISGVRGLKYGEAVATLSELTVRSIIKALEQIKSYPKLIILCGGGRKNKYFLKRVNELSSVKTINIDELNVNGDFIESAAFGYLAIRSVQSKPITYPETTGVSKPTQGGVLIKTN